MLAGRINRKTKAFSANHSYYDSTGIKEYFNSSESYRNYPYFENYTNQIIMYPVFSPSKLDIIIKVYCNEKDYSSKKFRFSSNSSNRNSFLLPSHMARPNELAKPQ